MNWRLLILILLIGVVSACNGVPLTSDGAQPTSTPAQPGDLSSSIGDTIQQAFATLPDEMANQDFTGFNQFIATADQGADINGLNQIYTWLQDVRLKGTAPAATSEYKLNELHITNVQIQGNEATAHVLLDMSKVAFGNDPNVAFTVDQDVALVQVDGHWLISGADPAQIQDLSKAPK